jgi:hypothetical protein
MLGQQLLDGLEVTKNMKKVFVSIKLILYSLFAPTIVLLIPLVAGVLNLVYNHAISFLLTCIFLNVLMSSIISIVHKHAFGLVKYSQEGIENRHLKLDFNDIHSITVIEVELLKYTFLPTISVQMVCLATDKQDCSFYHYPRKKCILMPYTPKVIDELFEFSSKQSEEFCALLESIK